MKIIKIIGFTLLIISSFFVGIIIPISMMHLQSNDNRSVKNVTYNQISDYDYTDETVDIYEMVARGDITRLIFLHGDGEVHSERDIRAIVKKYLESLWDSKLIDGDIYWDSDRFFVEYCVAVSNAWSEKEYIYEQYEQEIYYEEIDDREGTSARKRSLFYAWYASVSLDDFYVEFVIDENSGALLAMKIANYIGEKYSAVYSALDYNDMIKDFLGKESSFSLVNAMPIGGKYYVVEYYSIVDEEKKLIYVTDMYGNEIMVNWNFVIE